MEAGTTEHKPEDVFSVRYKGLIAVGGGRGWLKSVCDYVRLNAVRARLLGPKEPLKAYIWSTYGQYLEPVGKQISWVTVDRRLGGVGHCAGGES